MKLLTLIKLSKNHFRNILAEKLYLTTNKDLTKPNTFYGIITDRCNSKCLYCHHWRLDSRNEEMNLEEWKEAFLSIKKFVGSYSINFSGGEPFLKQGMFEIMKFLNKNDIKAGITTNGSILVTEKLAEKYVLSKPMNLNISCESDKAETHDYIRGFPGLHDKILSTVKNIKKAQEKHKIFFPLIMKVTINKLNYKDLTKLVSWSKAQGFSAINFQPIGPWTREAKEELTLDKNDLPLMEKIIKELIGLKKTKANIINSEKVLKQVVPFFKGEKIPKSFMPCKVGMRNFFIYPNGDVYPCTHMKPIGNIKINSAKKIWYSKTARVRRLQTIKCEKLCLAACSSDKSIWDKIITSFQLFIKK